MTDDVGFGAPSAFGGVIPTPALERIAKMGLAQLGQPRAAGHALRRPLTEAQKVNFANRNALALFPKAPRPAVHEPVSASSRTGLRVSKTEIEKKATRDGRVAVRPRKTLLKEDAIYTLTMR